MNNIIHLLPCHVRSCAEIFNGEPALYTGLRSAIKSGNKEHFLLWDEQFYKEYNQSIQHDFLTVQFNNELLRHFFKKMYIDLIAKNAIDLLRENLTWVHVDDAFMFMLLKEATFLNKPEIVKLLLTDSQLTIHAPIYSNNDSLIHSCIIYNNFNIFYLLVEELQLTSLQEINQYQLNLLMMILEYYASDEENPFVQYMLAHPEYEINANVYEYLAYSNIHPTLPFIFMRNAIRNNIALTEFHLGEKGNISWALSQDETDIPVLMMVFLKEHDYLTYIEHLSPFHTYCQKHDIIDDYVSVLNQRLPMDNHTESTIMI